MNNYIASVDCDAYESSGDENVAANPLLTSQQYMPHASRVLSLPRTACVACVGIIMSLSPVTAIADVWSDERRRRDTVTLAWVFDMPIGKPISRMQAIRLARHILEQAEQKRVEFVEFEARQGIQWGGGE